MLTLDSIKKLLGPNFKESVIYDPILDPYFIVRYAEGGFGVMKTRTDKNGNLKFKVESYPSSFAGCLDKIAKEKLHTSEDGPVFYGTLQEYIAKWNEISRTLLESCDILNITSR